MIECVIRFYYFSDNGSSTLHNEKDKTTSLGFFIFIMPYRLLLTLFSKPSKPTIELFQCLFILLISTIRSRDILNLVFNLRNQFFSYPLILTLFEFREDIL